MKNKRRPMTMWMAEEEETVSPITGASRWLVYIYIAHYTLRSAVYIHHELYGYINSIYVALILFSFSSFLPCFPSRLSLRLLPGAYHDHLRVSPPILSLALDQFAPCSSPCSFVQPFSVSLRVAR